MTEEPPSQNTAPAAGESPYPAPVVVPENQDKRNREIMRVTMNLMEADVGTLVQWSRAAEEAKHAREAPVTSVTEAKLQQATIHGAGTPAQKRWCQRLADAIKNGLDSYPMTQRTPWF